MMTAVGPNPSRRLDQWAEWLVSGRDETVPPTGVDFLGSVRDRVLGAVDLERARRVLDVGAGTGLITLAASSLIGSGGHVAAADISTDALRICARDAGRGATPVTPVAADAIRLPFRSSSFDAVFARSVLIYVVDKQAAIAEMWRVLAPGGRVSLFEPINVATKEWDRDEYEATVAAIPEHVHVRARFVAVSEHWDPMMGFDEQDLIRWFAAAGYTAIGLVHEVLVLRHQPTSEVARRWLRARGNPTAPTWEEAARAELGSGCEDYLDRLVAFRASRASSRLSAVVYLTATRG
jgi:ubiquinone/menaquinone biosynthesis C-methylase UbiE